MFATASANSCKKMQDIFTYRLEIYAKIIYIYTLRPASPDRLPEISISKVNHVFFLKNHLQKIICFRLRYLRQGVTR